MQHKRGKEPLKGLDSGNCVMVDDETVEKDILEHDKPPFSLAPKH